MLLELDAMKLFGFGLHLNQSSHGRCVSFILNSSASSCFEWRPGNE